MSGAAIKKIADEMQEKFDELGMQKVDEFGDKLAELMEQASKGPGPVVDALEEAFKGLTSKLEEISKDPAAAAPSGGMAQCADWYGQSVAGKLTVFSEDAKAMAEAATKLGSDLKGPLEQVATVLKGAVTQFENSLTRLSKMPKEMQKLSSVDSSDDIAKIDTEPMKKATDTSAIEGELLKVLSLKDALGGAVDAAKNVMAKLMEFLESAADQIRAAFDVPTPLCFLTQALMSEAPAAMTSLMEMVDKLKLIDLSVMLQMLEKLQDTIMNLDVAAVKTPVEQFGEFAKEKVDALDGVVTGAKAAGGMQALASANPFA
eukprot:TRINITY_DN27432_c0_g1_i1.p1 TRINITY_DN27432_c0_g1~~TRINITY_DN27432_c0_g1_i1.p1  ORF type:complete len:338 (-),score=110.60 TRINITY_DN27432_c0_g1_i1:219-1169(-)